VDSFGGTSPKAGEQDTHLSFQTRHNDGGIENDDLSLRPVEQEDFPTNPHLDDDEDSNGWQTIAQSTCQFSCLHLFSLLISRGWGW